MVLEGHDSAHSRQIAVNQHIPNIALVARVGVRVKQPYARQIVRASKGGNSAPASGSPRTRSK